jgi:hypothetical protein
VRGLMKNASWKKNTPGSLLEVSVVSIWQAAREKNLCSTILQKW